MEEVKNVFPVFLDFRTNRFRKTGCFQTGRILGPRGAQRHLKHCDWSSQSINSTLTLLLFIKDTVNIHFHCLESIQWWLLISGCCISEEVCDCVSTLITSGGKNTSYSVDLFAAGLYFISKKRMILPLSKTQTGRPLRCTGRPSSRRPSSKW